MSGICGIVRLDGKEDALKFYWVGGVGVGRNLSASPHLLKNKLISAAGLTQ